MLTNMYNPSTNGNFCDKHGSAIKPRTIQDYKWLCRQRGQNGQQLLYTMLDVEVDKETIFSHVELDSSEQLPPPDGIWCQNDSQTIHIFPRADLD
jgi:hypothetical protein